MGDPAGEIGRGQAKERRVRLPISVDVVGVARRGRRGLRRRRKGVGVEGLLDNVVAVAAGVRGATVSADGACWCGPSWRYEVLCVSVRASHGNL